MNTEPGGSPFYAGSYSRKSDGCQARNDGSESSSERGTVRVAIGAASFVDTAIAMRRSGAQFGNLMSPAGGRDDDLERAESKRMVEPGELGIHAIEAASRNSARVTIRS